MQDLKSRLCFLLRHVSFKKSSSSETEGGRIEGCASHHRIQIKRDTSVCLLSFLQCPLIVILGRCACMYLQILPNALPLWSLCILLNMCSDKQGTTWLYLMPASSCAHPTASHHRSLPSIENLRCTSPCTSLSPLFLTYSTD